MRHSEPGKYDQCPYGTACKVMKSELLNEFEVYIQLSNDQDNPRWESLGEFTSANEDQAIQRINSFL